MTHPEHNLQCACVKWFRLQYPKYKLRLWATPNAAIRSPQQGQRMKAEGMLAGVPDLFLAVTTERSAGLFIEMKAGKGRLSESQKTMLTELKSAGYNIAVCNSFDGFKDIVENYLK